MAGKRSAAWPTPPDLDETGLEAWTAVALGAGFALEEVRIEDADLADTRAAGGSFVGCVLSGASVTGSRWRSLTLTDVVARDSNAANADWTGARMKRVVFVRCRMTGVDFSEVEADEVAFRSCKLDLASFRFAKLRRTTFEDCRLDEADFHAASLQQVQFARSELRRVDFAEARLNRVDLRTSELEDLRGDVHALRGAIIDSVQLAGLAHLLADRLGIDVDDDAP